ncbi:MAG TPA: Ppx/GppA phosphatase family protein [Syntrophomonadaceae bacterium]|nr:Ppx/GppA phosphatase family protein [Syntrophomonadaceae bacterium]
MRCAAIDIGTNSCRLLIGEASTEGFQILCRDLESTRMGQGLAAYGVLSMEAIRRTVACLQHFQEQMAHYQVQAYRVVATSAVREAKNRQEFLERVQKECSGMRVEVIAGEEEAWLSFQGVCSGLGLKTSPLVVDLGGGSTEIVWQDHQPHLLSFPVGAVRATEEAMDDHRIQDILAPLLDISREMDDHPLVFVGGTATSLVAIKLALSEYNSELVHGHRLMRQEIEKIFQNLQSLSLEERRHLPGLEPKRADIIIQGARIMLAVMKILGREQTLVSESDLLNAIICKIYTGG